MNPALALVAGAPATMVPQAKAPPFISGGPAAAYAAFGIDDIAANASLLLLVGGLAMLALIVVLVMLQSMLPDHGARPDESHEARQLRPVAATGADGTTAPGSPGPLPDTLAPTIDKAMDHAVGLRLGEPRLLHVQADLARVRLYSCAGCADRHPGGATAPGCFEQARALGASFTQTFGGHVRSQEILCRLRGDPECEFEVRH